MANQKVAARFQVGPICLLFFIDETGHETFADKNYPRGLPELEVPDFIMHAAGRMVAQIHRDPVTPFGKDFIVVFQSNPNLSSYIHMEECSKD
jgi:hypothetical protein